MKTKVNDIAPDKLNITGPSYIETLNKNVIDGKVKVKFNTTDYNRNFIKDEMNFNYDELGQKKDVLVLPETAVVIYEFPEGTFKSGDEISYFREETYDNLFIIYPDNEIAEYKPLDTLESHVLKIVSTCDSLIGNYKVQRLVFQTSDLGYISILDIFIFSIPITKVDIIHYNSDLDVTSREPRVDYEDKFKLEFNDSCDASVYSADYVMGYNGKYSLIYTDYDNQESNNFSNLDINISPIGMYKDSRNYKGCVKLTQALMNHNDLWFYFGANEDEYNTLVDKFKIKTQNNFKIFKTYHPIPVDIRVCFVSDMFELRDWRNMFVDLNVQNFDFTLYKGQTKLPSVNITKNSISCGIDEGGGCSSVGYFNAITCHFRDHESNIDLTNWFDNWELNDDISTIVINYSGYTNLANATFKTLIQSVIPLIRKFNSFDSKIMGLLMSTVKDERWSARYDQNRFSIAIDYLNTVAVSPTNENLFSVIKYLIPELQTDKSFLMRLVLDQMYQPFDFSKNGNKLDLDWNVHENNKLRMRIITINTPKKCIHKSVMKAIYDELGSYGSHFYCIDPDTKPAELMIEYDPNNITEFDELLNEKLARFIYSMDDYHQQIDLTKSSEVKEIQIKTKAAEKVVITFENRTDFNNRILDIYSSYTESEITSLIFDIDGDETTDLIWPDDMTVFPYELRIKNILHQPGMFKNKKKLTDTSIFKFDESKIDIFESWFDGCESLTDLPITTFSKYVKSAAYMYTNMKLERSNYVLGFQSDINITGMFQDTQVGSYSKIMKEFGNNYKTNAFVISHYTRIESDGPIHIIANDLFKQTNKNDDMYITLYLKGQYHYDNDDLTIELDNAFQNLTGAAMFDQDFFNKVTTANEAFKNCRLALLTTFHQYEQSPWGDVLAPTIDDYMNAKLASAREAFAGTKFGYNNIGIKYSRNRKEIEYIINNVPNLKNSDFTDMFKDCEFYPEYVYDRPDLGDDV